jgi:hypothetical protein
MAKTTAEATETEWRALYDAADELKALAPWEWMLDSDLFAVRDPESGQIGYCCVMGNLGEHYALAVYLGADGLRGYEEVASGAYAERPAQALFAQRCLMVSFEDRELLDKESYAQIKALGRKYRGRQAWPELRDYTPGYLPWRLEPPQSASSPWPFNRRATWPGASGTMRRTWTGRTRSRCCCASMWAAPGRTAGTGPSRRRRQLPSRRPPSTNCALSAWLAAA